MAVAPRELERLIKAAFPDAEVTIEDLRGDGEHYAVYVQAEEFRGQTRVRQHQMVYEALQGLMDRDLHAMALQTRVPLQKS